MVMTATTPTTTTAGGRLVSTDGRELPLQSVHLSAQAGGGIARVVLTQRFRNPFDEPLEVRYLLPLPSDGAVSGFSFVLKDERVVGEVTGKQQARERFEQAMAQGRTAALLEQDRSSLFTQRVGNVPPRTEILAEVVIDQPLRWLEEGEWEWRFPTVVGPRYQGEPGRVADAAKTSVPVADCPTGAGATLVLNVLDGLTGKPTSSSHGLETAERKGFHEVRLDTAASLDRDLVISWPVALPSVSARVLAARPNTAAHDGDTFSLLTVAPPTSGGVAMPRDLTFLIDTSGSMGGQPLDQAKHVMQAMIATLGVHDRIEMIEFGSAPRRWKKEPVPATEAAKAEAAAWVRSLGARGSTEMHRAVLEALRPLREVSQRQVILLTDGYIGFEREIVTTLLQKLPAGARLHTVGVGSSVNRSLTQAAARAGRGTELIIGVGEDAEKLVHRLLVKTSAPLVTDLLIEGPGIVEVAPRQLPDLYAESPAVIALRTTGAGTFTVRGRTAEGPFEQTLTIPALEAGEGHGGIAALFAREKVEDLETTITAGESKREVDETIEATGVSFQIATRLTSWVAVSKRVMVDVNAQGRTVEQPHELPYGVSAEGLGLRQASSLDSLSDRLSSRQSFAAPSAAAGGAPPQVSRGRVSGKRKRPAQDALRKQESFKKSDRREQDDDAPSLRFDGPADPPPAEPEIVSQSLVGEVPDGLTLRAPASEVYAEAEVDSLELLDEAPVSEAKPRPSPGDMRLTRDGALLDPEARRRMEEDRAQFQLQARAARKTARLRWTLLLLFMAALAIVALWLAGVINLGG